MHFPLAPLNRATPMAKHSARITNALPKVAFFVLERCPIIIIFARDKNKGSPKAPAKETSARDANFPFLPSLLRLSSRETPFLVVYIAQKNACQTNSIINTKDRSWGDFFVSTFLDFLIEGAVFLNTQTTRALHFHWRPLFCVSLFCTRRQLLYLVL